MLQEPLNEETNIVSLISFGKEAIGTIIESPQIAEAFREIFAMAQVGAEVLMDVPKTE